MIATFTEEIKRQNVQMEIIVAEELKDNTFPIRFAIRVKDKEPVAIILSMSSDEFYAIYRVMEEAKKFLQGS